MEGQVGSHRGSGRKSLREGRKERNITTDEQVFLLKL